MNYHISRISYLSTLLLLAAILAISGLLMAVPGIQRAFAQDGSTPQAPSQSMQSMSSNAASNAAPNAFSNANGNAVPLQSNSFSSNTLPNSNGLPNSNALATATPIQVYGAQQQASAVCPTGLMTITGILPGQQISGIVYLQASFSGSNPEEVEFLINRADGSRYDRDTESIAPYFYLGDDDGEPEGWDTSDLPPDLYTLHVSAIIDDLICNSQTLSFTVGALDTAPLPTLPPPTATSVPATPLPDSGDDNADAPISSCPTGIMSVLGITDGQQLQGVVNVEAVFSGEEPDRVYFMLTGPDGDDYEHRESIAPFYFLGDSNGRPKGWDTSRYPAGAYLMNVRAVLDGEDCHSQDFHLSIGSAPAPSNTPAPTNTPPPTNAPTLSPTDAPTLPAPTATSQPPAATSAPATPLPDSSCPTGIMSVLGITDGQQLQGVVNVEAIFSGEEPDRVYFTLTGPDGDDYEHRESIAPFYFLGDDDGEPNGWDTSRYPAGAYLMNVRAVLDGEDCHSQDFRLSIGSAPAPSNTPAPTNTPPPAQAEIALTGDCAQPGQALFTLSNSGQADAIDLEYQLAINGQHSESGLLPLLAAGQTLLLEVPAADDSAITLSLPDFGHSATVNNCAPEAPEDEAPETPTPAPSGEAIEVQLSYFYHLPDNMNLSELAQTADFLILSRGDLSDEPNLAADLAAAGFDGLLLQYLRFDAIEGPAYLKNASAGSCTSSQQAFTPYSNHVATQVGEFCQLHNSIVNRSPFDHDLNPATPDVVATEDWFIHNSAGERMGNSNEQWDGETGFYYHINPGVPAMQEYWAARALRELRGGAGYNGTGFHGIFADNVELDWEKKIERLDVGGTLQEYSSNSSYRQQVLVMAQRVDSILGGAGYPFYGNLIEDQYNADWGWDQFLPVMDGALLENFALSWNNPIKASELEQQLSQAEQWAAAGRNVVLVSQGDNNADEALYALAAYLLVTDGQHVFFRHATSSDYRDFWQYPAYDLQLGAAQGGRSLLSDGSNGSDLVYERHFECGSVRLNVTRTQGDITLIEGCMPGSFAAQ